MKTLLPILILSFLFSNNLVLASEKKGLQIIQELDKRNTGWTDSQASLQMVMKNRNGDEHTRKLKIKNLEVKDDGDKRLMIFASPRDVKGTAFLSFTHALEADDQWLYLPSSKRIKRVSSVNKSGAFLGSEFSYEDLSSLEIEKYSYKYLRDEMLGNIDCFVIETTPQYKYSGYARRLLWIDKNRYITLKIDYYDRNNSLLKTQEFHNYEIFLDKYWRANETIMINHKKGKSTKLIWSNYQFQQQLTARDFDKNSLKRVR